MPRDGKERLRPVVDLREHGNRAIDPFARGGKEPRRSLLLHHEQHPLRQQRQKTLHNGRCNVVGEITGHDVRRIPHKRRNVGTQNIACHDLEARVRQQLRQKAREKSVLFHGDHPLCAREQLLRQRAEPRANLQHGQVRKADARCGCGEQRALNAEILAERGVTTAAVLGKDRPNPFRGKRHSGKPSFARPRRSRRGGNVSIANILTKS